MTSSDERFYKFCFLILPVGAIDKRSTSRLLLGPRKVHQDAWSTIFIQTLSANFYSKLEQCLRQTQFLSKFGLDLQIALFLTFLELRVFSVVETVIYKGRR